MTLDEVVKSDSAVLTIAEVASVLRIDERTVRRGCANGDLPSVHVGRRLLVPRLDLLKILGAA